MSVDVRASARNTVSFRLDGPHGGPINWQFCEVSLLSALLHCACKEAASVLVRINAVRSRARPMITEVLDVIFTQRTRCRSG